MIMKHSRAYRATLLCSVFFCGLGAGRSAWADTAAAAIKDLTEKEENVTVTGTVLPGNSAISTSTKRHSTVQVTVVSGAQLLATGQSNLTQALAQMSPDVSSPPLGGGGASSLTQTIQLRGLSPDHTLILVDGHRRHIGANLNALAAPNWGSEPTDISLIPISLVDHVEVITEGASALYGQDAIAGAINIVLKKNTHGGSINFKNSGYYAGDGQSIDATGNYSFAIGRKGGYADLGFQILHQLPTNRSGDYVGTMYYPLANGQPDPRAAVVGRDVQRNLGLPKTTTETIGDNIGIPITDNVSFYNTSTYGHRNVHVANTYRSPADAQTVEALYPYGMQPYLDMEENDFQVNTGFKGKSFHDIAWDAYVNYARDEQQYYNMHSNNPTYGLDSPTNFYDGQTTVSELSAGFKGSKSIDLGFLPRPVGLSFGTEYRHDTFQMGEGEYASWADGGVPILAGPSAGKAANPGATDHAGNPPLSATNNNRDVYDGFVNLDFFVTKKWEWTLGGHATGYSRLPTVVTGSVGTRYNFSKRYAIRASINTGYRPPTLGQENYFYSSPHVGYSVDTLPGSSAAARALGAQPLKGEYSRSFSVGVDMNPIDDFEITGNLYYIAINDRIYSTTTFAGTQVESILAAAGLTGVTNATYFANIGNTNTFGGNLQASYMLHTPRAGTFKFSLGVNLTDNEMRSHAKAPQVIQNMGLSYFNSYVQEVMLRSAPKNRENLSMDWRFGKFSLFVQEMRYGSVVNIESPTTDASQWQLQKPAFLTDLEVGYRVIPRLYLAVGADNLFNKYPTRQAASALSSSTGANIYNRNSPYGFNGGMYYVRANLDF